MTKMASQPIRSRLNLLDAQFANQIWSIKNDTILRLFACECALLALTHCGNGDQRSLKAIEIGSHYARGQVNDGDLNLAYREAENAAEVADEVAFTARDAFEAGKSPISEYKKAFGAARAAFSAQECCSKVAMEAAHEAAYEAWSALSTVIKIRNILNDLISPNLSDTDTNAAIVEIFRNILEKLNE